MNEKHGTATGSDSAESGLPSSTSAELVRGTSLGRYVVLEKLGAGGMGVVYAAYDPQLDRKVAIKLLRHDRVLGAGQRSAKLLDEAKKLAALSHPNVVTIHDVGTYLGQIFIAMEFMAGGTVGAWLEVPHPWREVLSVFVQAGHGLAAAHVNGQVHRDFKPDNVLLDANRKARVTDFGLARRGTVAAVAAESVRPGSRPAGTPGFQAPEMVRREEVDARSDQFCFCLSLHLGLYGVPAFSSEADLRQPLPPVHPPPAGTQVPGWVRRVLLKGLSEKPADRYPSMDALLIALESDPAVQRRTVLGQVGALFVLAAATFSGVTLLQRESPEQRAERECLERVAKDVEGIWGPPRRAEIERAFRKASPAVGGERWAAIDVLLTPRVGEWATAAKAACRIRDETTARVQGVCLHEHRETLQSLSDLFAIADLEVVDNALNAAMGEVTPASACALTQVRPAAPAADGSGPEEKGRAALARARVLWAAGSPLEALEVARATMAQAHEAGALNVEAEALLLAGKLSRGDDTEKQLREAMRISDGLGDDVVRARAAIALTQYYADNNRGPESRWANQEAIAITRRLGTPPLLHASQLIAEAGLGGLDQAAKSKNLEEALTIRAQLLSPEHPDVVRAKQALGGALKNDRGFALLAEVLETRRRTLGPHHAETAQAHRTLGLRLMEMNNCAPALVHFEAALGIHTSPDRPSPRPLTLGRAYAILGTCQACLERYKDAEESLTRAMPLLESGETVGQQRRDYETLLDAMAHLGRSPAERAAVEEDLRALQE